MIERLNKNDDQLQEDIDLAKRLLELEGYKVVRLQEDIDLVKKFLESEGYEVIKDDEI